MNSVYMSVMKSYPLFLMALLGLLASCSSSDYFVKEAKKRAPHAVLALRNGPTQINKINDKYPPEDAGTTIRLAPGKHRLEVSSTGQQAIVMGGLFGAPSQEISSEGIMQVDLAPGKSYRPEATLNAAGTYFFLRDENGNRTSVTRSYTAGF